MGDFEARKEAETPDGGAEQKKRKAEADKVRGKYQDSDPEKEDAPDEYFERKPKLAGAKRGRGNRKEQKNPEKNAGAQERTKCRWNRVCTRQRAYSGCMRRSLHTTENGPLGNGHAFLDTGAT